MTSAGKRKNCAEWKKNNLEDKDMAEVKIKRTETSGDYSTETVSEAADID